METITAYSRFLNIQYLQNVVRLVVEKLKRSMNGSENWEKWSMSMKVICRFMILRIHYNDVSEVNIEKNNPDNLLEIKKQFCKKLENFKENFEEKYLQNGIEKRLDFETVSEWKDGNKDNSMGKRIDKLIKECLEFKTKMQKPDIKNKQPSVSEEYFDSEESFKNEEKQSGVKNFFSKYFKIFQQLMRLLKLFLLFKLILFVCLSDCAQDDKAESSGASKDVPQLPPYGLLECSRFHTNTEGKDGRKPLFSILKDIRTSEHSKEARWNWINKLFLPLPQWRREETILLYCKNELEVEDEHDLSICLQYIFEKLNMPENKQRGFKLFEWLKEQSIKKESPMFEEFKDGMKAKERSKLLELLIKDRNESLAFLLRYTLYSTYPPNFDILYEIILARPNFELKKIIEHYDKI
uniref:Uncharacterized protein n=1 Tax=Meloidogyne floridensis TaxID=298350 RepID=A0A915NL08_9BILA